MITLRLYSRPQCHLCEKLLEDLRPCLDDSTGVEIVDISDDPLLMRRYGLRIPVLACGEKELSAYPLDLERVRAFLATQIV